MKFILFFSSFAIILLSGCDNPKPSKYIPFSEISTKDSLALVNQLFDSLHAEIYQDERYRVFEDVPGVIPCGGQNLLLTINVNKKNQIQVRSKITDSITQEVFNYYNTNRLNNDVTNNYPLFSRLSLIELKRLYSYSLDDLKKFETTDNVRQEILEFKRFQLNEWKEKYEAFRTLAIDTLSEVQYSSLIVLNYPESYDNKVELLNKILLAHFELRDNRSHEFFNKSYLEVFYESLLFKRDFRHKALKTLHPIKLQDIPYCKEHDFWMTNIPAPPPPMQENY